MHNDVKFNVDGTFHDRKGSGRPRQTTPREAVSRESNELAIELLQEILAILRLKGTAIRLHRSQQTVSTDSHRRAQKLHLTPVMKKTTQDFARCHRHWTLAKWKKGLFSDECTMQQFVPRHIYIRRPFLTRNML